MTNSLTPPRRNSKKYFLLPLVGGLSLWGAAWGVAQGLNYAEGREKPTKQFSSVEPPTAQRSAPQSLSLPEGGDTEIQILRSKAETNENDPTAWKALGNALLERIAASPQESPNEAAILEAIDTFLKVVAINPTDQDAQLSLGDLTFDRRLFAQAVNFYQKYLALNPSDSKVRGRYASALTFVGKFDESIKELESVLKEQPKDFQALAYLSITYAQKGDKTRALSYAQQALEVAPQEEAKLRLRKFMESISVASVDSSQERGTFEASLRQHPIAGQKVVKVVTENDKAIITVRDFPMEAMPPFARKKFIDTLFSYPGSASLKELVFIDATTGQELAREVKPR